MSATVQRHGQYRLFETPQGNRILALGDGLWFAWVNGEYRCGLYNHWRRPNSPEADCMGVQVGGGVKVQFTPFGWRTARSAHAGGVNLLLADGSLQFTADEIDTDVWSALSTIAGHDHGESR